MTRKTATPRAGKGEQTRAKILDAALALFMERGFEATTMRAVAEEADVSLGNAYYYFESKEELVQAFYEKSHQEHLAATAPRLDGERDFRKRVLATLHAKIDTSEPYHRFSGVLFRSAADPQSPLNPFSGASKRVRDEAIALMERVVDESSLGPPADLRRELPYLLWLYEMGVILFWIFDTSRERRRTRVLIDRTVPIVTRLIILGANPILAPLRKAVLRLIRDLRDGDALSEAGAR
ncbi:MAG TPA: TetR family transcriptional regulator [Gemmatimonadaceae bacterium]|nr:TetR family transcriptional regulator [Gemmatimonadaceae bacterium]